MARSAFIFLISVVLAIFYFGVLTPIILATRLVYDPLHRKLRPSVASYLRPLVIKGTPQAEPNESQAHMVTTVQQQIDDAIERLDTVIPISQPLLWAARCSMEAATLLLQADSQPTASGDKEKETLLEALGAARAAVGAATYACGR